MADRFALLLLPVTLITAGGAWYFSGDPIRFDDLVITENNAGDGRQNLGDCRLDVTRNHLRPVVILRDIFPQITVVVIHGLDTVSG